MMNEYKTMRVCEKKNGKVWEETYRNENPENVYEFLANALRNKYLWKSPIYGRVIEKSIGDGTFREITIYEKSFTTNGYDFRTRYIVKR